MNDRQPPLLLGRVPTVSGYISRSTSLSKHLSLPFSPQLLEVPLKTNPKLSHYMRLTGDIDIAVLFPASLSGYPLLNPSGTLTNDFNVSKVRECTHCRM
jgi:hypothetical protein